MIQRGIGWQYLRSLALDAIPEQTRVYHTRAVPLNEWRRHGAFSVLSSTKKQIVIEAAGAEIGSALLADTEHLLDHAAEHRACVHDAVTPGSWNSPAWTVVTAYYWAFFSVLALTRLTGRSAVFLDRQAVSDLRTLAGSADQPGAGALYLAVEPYTTATTRTMTLRPSKAQLHDAVWTVTHRLISDVSAHSDENANPTEHRLWWALKRAGDLLGADWTSKLRNAVNYRLGCGYREVTRTGQIDIARHIARFTAGSVNDLADEFEDEVVGIPARLRDPGEDVRLFSRLLGLYAVLAASIVDTLHVDVLERQGGDQRWRGLRARFLAERCSTPSHATWPFLG